MINLFKKFLSVVTVFFCISFGNVSAQEVTVTGMGVDKNEALRDASRLAVEQVVGTYIDSRTLMKDLMIQLDEVYKKSQGYIKNIQVLNAEQIEKNLWRVQAKIDVDTNPNGKLIDEITMLMQLNDPRIAVFVFDMKAGSSTRYEIAEEILNEKLLSMNFSHILNSSVVIKQNNATLLNNLANNKQGLFKGKDNAADYLVVGKYSKISNPVSIPQYGKSGMLKTDMTNVKTTLKVEVIKYDTGEIVGTFAADGTGIGNNEKIAELESLRNSANVAAEKLAETFKKFSSKSTSGMTFTITATSDAKLQQIINELRGIGIIDNVFIREQKKNIAVLSVESSQKPHSIVTVLKGRTKLGVFVESITNSTCKLKVN